MRYSGSIIFRASGCMRGAGENNDVFNVVYPALELFKLKFRFCSANIQNALFLIVNVMERFSNQFIV